MRLCFRLAGYPILDKEINVKITESLSIMAIPVDEFSRDTKLERFLAKNQLYVVK